MAKCEIKVRHGDAIVTIGDVERAVYERLEALGIPWTRHEHPPVLTVEEAQAHWAAIDATHCKNLFVRNKKGTTHYLVVVEQSKRADLGKLASQLGEDRLSFASPERLQTHLGLTPGSVSPFGLIHEGARGVRVVLDADMREAARLAFHPNVNTATIVISAADFERFLASCGNVVRHVRFETP
jgi:Ala-tRNA(Pro) deacylase